MHVATSSAFKKNAHDALGNAGLQKALARSGPSFIARRAAAVAALPEFEELREHGARHQEPRAGEPGFLPGGL